MPLPHMNIEMRYITFWCVVLDFTTRENIMFINRSLVEETNQALRAMRIPPDLLEEYSKIFELFALDTTGTPDNKRQTHLDACIAVLRPAFEEYGCCIDYAATYSDAEEPTLTNIAPPFGYDWFCPSQPPTTSTLT